MSENLAETLCFRSHQGSYGFGFIKAGTSYESCLWLSQKAAGSKRLLLLLPASAAEPQSVENDQKQNIFVAYRKQVE